MPINACSINRHTINGKCGLITIINNPLKGYVRNIPPTYSRLHKNIDEYEAPIIYEQPYILVTVEILNEIYSETQENIPLDMGSIIFINNLSTQETKINININGLRIEKNVFNT